MDKPNQNSLSLLAVFQNSLVIQEKQTEGIPMLTTISAHNIHVELVLLKGRQAAMDSSDQSVWPASRFPLDSNCCNRAFLSLFRYLALKF